jgi:hypothetical protein
MSARNHGPRLLVSLHGTSERGLGRREIAPARDLPDSAPGDAVPLAARTGVA